MVNFAAHIQRYQWPLIGLALIMVQSMPLAVKVVGIIGLCVIALTNHAVLLIVVAATSPLYLMPVTLTDTAAIPLHEIVWESPYSPGLAPVGGNNRLLCRGCAMIGGWARYWGVQC